MENDPRNYEEPPIKLLLERFGKWYIAKWWNPLIPLVILLSSSLLTITIYYSEVGINEEFCMFLDILSLLALIAAAFTSFVHFLLEKRWLDFCLLFLTSIILVCVFLFLALQIAIAHGDCL
ncbi:MAG: hypothetical protein IJU47_00520 [Verrucomicrobia bacterium]|nr:hypothetical protein [Verrucomicrobiota bacterium]